MLDFRRVGVPLCGPPKPIAPIDPVLGISLVGHSRDVIRLFSRAAVGFPIGARLKSKTPHEGAGFIEGAPIAATTTATSKPVAPTVPPGIGIGLVGVARDVVGLFPGAAVRSPVAGRFEAEAARECASFLEGAPIAATTTATSKPVAPTVPPGIGINSLGTRRNIVGPLSRATVRPPFRLRFESKTLHEGASFDEESPIAASTTISKPVAPTVPPGIGINSLGTRRNIVGPLSRATVRPPFRLRFESKTLHEGASFVEGRPL